MRFVLLALLSVSIWAATPVLDFRFDTYVPKSYILDSVSGFRLDAVSIGKVPGVLCSAANFSKESVAKGKWQKSFGNAVSLSVWVRLFAPQQSYARVVEFSDRSGHYRYSTALAFDVYGRVIRGWTSNAKGRRSKEVQYDLARNGYFDNRWHHIAYVYDGKRAKLFIDGELKSAVSTDISDVTDAQTLVVGGYYLDSSQYKMVGDMDELKIYDEALSDDEVRRIYLNEQEGRNDDAMPRICPLLAEFRMDSCSYEEGVKDSSVYKRDARAIGVRPSLEGILCNAAKFDARKSEVVLLQPSILNAQEDFAITMWFKTTSKEKRWTLVSGANESRDDELRLSCGDDGRCEVVLKGVRALFVFDISLNDGEWHQIAWTREEEESCIVVDGENRTKICKRLPRSGGALDIERLVLGGYGQEGTFEGELDEVKIFSRKLEDEEIETIYKNESNGVSGDGSTRSCPCCNMEYDAQITPIEFEGDRITLPDTYKKPSWLYVKFRHRFKSVPVVFIVIDSYGSNPATARIRNVTTEGFEVSLVEPHGEDGPHWSQKLSYFAINEGVHKLGDSLIEVGRIATKKVQGKYAPAQNEKGWQRVVPKVRFCDPAVVANIQTLNNLQSNPPKEPLVPWATAAVTMESGAIELALDMSETRKGVFEKEEIIGYMIAQGNIQGSFLDDTNHTITFETILTPPYFVGWDNGCKEVSFRNDYQNRPLVAAWKDSRDGADGGWPRICKLDTSSIGLVIDEDRAYDTERGHIPERGAIFAFSDSFILRGAPQEQSDAPFDVWDRYSDSTRRRLFSEIVQKPFVLTLAQREENGTIVGAFEGDVCVTIYDEGSLRQISDWSKTHWIRGMREHNITLVAREATRSARAYIYWSQRPQECGGLFGHAGSEANSSDRFSIRPKGFTLLMGEKHYAAEGFSLHALALDYGAKPARGYETNATISAHIQDSDRVCTHLDADFNLSTFSFRDGEGVHSARFDDVGKVVLAIKDTKWTMVDQNGEDCNASSRCWQLLGGERVDAYGRFCCVIEGEKRDVVITPYRAKITDARLQTSTAKRWLYMDSNISEFNVSAQASLELVNKEEKPVPNFDSSCYSADLDVKFVYGVQRADGNDDFVLKYRGDIEDSNGSLEAIHKVLHFFARDFNLSRARKSYHFGVARDFSKPRSPLFVALDKVAIWDAPYLKEKVEKRVEDSNVTFYYGRIKSVDITTNRKEDEVPLLIEVYDGNASKYTRSLNRDSLHWYQMRLHTQEQYGWIERMEAKSDVIRSSEVVDMVIEKRLTPGAYRVTLHKPKERDFAYVHLAISPWLWFSYDKSNGYSFELNSSCAQHPCIHYLYRRDDRGFGVRSGQVQGVDFEQNVTNKRRGVKVFR